MILSKTFDPADYEKLGEYAQHIETWWGLPGREEHPHRKWEYSMAYAALAGVNAHTVLDVGGGGSRFAPTMIVAGMDVLQIDPADNYWLTQAQSKAIDKPVPYNQTDFMRWSAGEFDAVTCISVLEHINDDFSFFMKLVNHVRPGGVLYITVDFSQAGQPFCGLHLRTYTENMLTNLALSSGLSWHGGQHDYTWHGSHVYDWTFASMTLQKI